MGNPVVFFEVIGKDSDALQKFYTEAFGWKVDTDNPMNYGMVDTGAGDAAIRGGIGAPPDASMPGHLTFYIAVDDTDKALEQIEALGGKTVVPTTQMGDMVTFAHFADPAGNLVGIVKNQ
jgi:uncharacterized protein